AEEAEGCRDQEQRKAEPQERGYRRRLVDPVDLIAEELEVLERAGPALDRGAERERLARRALEKRLPAARELGREARLLGIVEPYMALARPGPDRETQELQLLGAGDLDDERPDRGLEGCG